MSFLEKDDTSDWQAYFHYRNRLVAAAMHGPDDPKALLTDILKRTVRHLMLMEYSAVALQHKALRDFLAGPEALFPACRWCSARSARRGPSTTTGARSTRPRRCRRAAWTRSPRRPSRRRPRRSRRSSRPLPAASSATCAGRTPRITTSAAQRVVAACAVVRAVAGSTRRRCRPRTAAASPSVAATRSSSAASSDLGAAAGVGGREWPTLRRRYREAAPHLTSREGWKQIFDA